MLNTLFGNTDTTELVWGEFWGPDQVETRVGLGRVSGAGPSRKHELVWAEFESWTKSKPQVGLGRVWELTKSKTQVVPSIDPTCIFSVEKNI